MCQDAHEKEVHICRIRTSLYCCEFAPAGVRSAAYLQSQPRRPPDGQFSRDFPELTPEPCHGWVFNLTTAVPIVYPCKIGSLAELDIPKYTWAVDRATVPRRRSAWDTNRLSGPFRSAVTTERVLSPTSPDPILFNGCLKPSYLFRDARWHFQ